MPDNEGRGTVKATVIAGIFAVIAAIIGGIFLILNTLCQQGTFSFCAASTNKTIDPIVGVWNGTAKSSVSGTIPVTFTVAKSCTIGSTCGSFNLPSIPCSGKFRIVSVVGNTFHFLAENKQGACSAGTAIEDSLTLLPDGTLQYVARGDFGETRGILKRLGP